VEPWCTGEAEAVFIQHHSSRQADKRVSNQRNDPMNTNPTQTQSRLNLRRITRGWRAGVLILAATVAIAQADTVNLPASADNFIIDGLPNNNAGGTAWFDAGTDGGGRVRRGLLKFNLGGIPAGATITGAELRLTVTKTPSTGGAASNVRLYRLNAGWGEGVQGGFSGGTAVAGESTWAARMLDTALWTSGGAASDAQATISASADVAAGGTIAWSSAGMIADAQLWLDSPAQNFGWLLRSDNEGTIRSVRGFGSREDTVVGNRPVLVVDYTAPPPPNIPPTIAITNPVNGAVFFAPATVTIEAEASDADGTVTQVEFFDGAASLGIDATAPYSVAAGLAAGSHPLTAVATDNSGAMSTSAVVTVSVTTSNFNNPIVERIAKGSVTVELRAVADGMIAPISMSVANDGTGRMFVYDQAGVVWLVTAAGRAPTPVLDVRPRLVNISSGYDERGLLGLALHPGFSSNRLFYTYTSEPSNAPPDFATTLNPGTTNNHQSVIAEWQLDAVATNQANLASRRELLRVDQPQSNHNGGAMRFGPDGFLYIAFGDGGSANDVANGHSPGGNGQDTNSILGKVVRIDVNGSNSANGKYGIPLDNPFVGAPGVDETYAYGLRNPFSFSFDRNTGDLWLADVGQNKIEEIDIIYRGSNYGWNVKEGTFFFNTNGYVTNVASRPVPPDLVDPVAQYDRDDGTAVIGGHVYRGSALPALSGRYVFGDWGIFGSPSGRLYYLDSGNVIKELRLGLEDRPLGLFLKGYGEDAAGELYIFTSKGQGPGGFGGAMYKLVPAPETALAFNSRSITNGTNFQTTTTGGTGPFANQRKLVLDEPFCMIVGVSTNRSAVVPTRGPTGFFRQSDTARHPAVPFTAYLAGANERPTPLVNGATGFGIFALEGNSLTFTIRYGGLSGNASAAHIHGSAPASGTAGVMFDLAPYHTGTYGSNGSFSGTVVLSDAQKAAVMSGLTYVNVHTAANPGGEMRGQIAPVNMQSSLLGAYETGGVSTPARGFGSFTLVGTQLTFTVNYSGLTGAASAAHIHGAAPLGQNAGVMIDLSPFNGGGFGTAGTFSGTTNLNPTQLAAVIDGLTYVNIHTAANPGGEIRGQIAPHVTAVPLTAWISGTNERPTALVNSANGTAVMSLEGNTLAFNIKYAGLSGAPTGAHIHGPATSGNSAGVQFDLMPFANGTPGTAGAYSGTVVLNATQRAGLLAGQYYVNFHTAANPGGEARGNISTVLLAALATGSAERATPTVTSGSALGLFTLVSTQLNMSIVYKGLTGTASAAHIHGAAAANATAGVILDFGPFNGGAYGAAGAVSGQTMTTPAVLNALLDGLGYINFHSGTFPSGEVRGQIGR
jgi:glucose/arabinose dehydrogenase